MKQIYKCIITAIFINLFPFLLYAQVGINTSDPLKETMLDVNGNVIIEKPANPQGDVSFIFRDRKTGIIKKNTDLRNKPIFIYHLKLRTGSKNGYWEPNVEEYNTGIPSDKYFAFITDATLMAERNDLPAFFTLNKAWENKSSYKDRVIPLKRAYLKERDGYFRFYGQFVSTDIVTPDVVEENNSTTQYYWSVSVVVFRRTHMTYIDAGKYTMLGIVKGLNDVPSTGYHQYTKEQEGTNVAVVPPKLPPALVETKGTYSLTTSATAAAVGIGTVSPAVELDVEGKVAIQQVKTNTISNLFPLALDNKSKVLVANTKLKKPFIFIKGQISCLGDYNGDEDWIYDFDTGITTKTYNVINTNSYMGNSRYDELVKNNQVNGPIPSEDGYSYRRTGHIIGIRPFIDLNKGKESYGKREGKTYYPQPSVSLLPQDDGKWHYKADYHGTGPVAGKVTNARGSGDNGVADFDVALYRSDFKKKFYWKFNWLAVSTIFSENFGVFEDQIPGGQVRTDNPPNLEINGKKYNDIIEYFIVKKGY